MTTSEPRTVHHGDYTTVTECDGDLTFTFGHGNFKSSMTVTWGGLVEMVRFAVFPLGGENPTKDAEIAGLPRHLAERADR